ncbi:MAG: hypothetical protein WCO05_02880 [Candidatus Moraniibacteriota bacterium]
MHESLSPDADENKHEAIIENEENKKDKGDDFLKKESAVFVGFEMGKAVDESFARAGELVRQEQENYHKQVGKIQNSLKKFNPIDQEEFVEGFQKLAELDEQQKGAYEKYIGRMKKMFVAGMLTLAMNFPVFASEVHDEESAPQKTIEQPIKIPLKAESLEVGMTVNEKALVRSLMEQSDYGKNEYAVCFSKDGEDDAEDGKIIFAKEQNKRTGSIDFEVMMGALKDGGMVESVHTHPVEIGKTYGVNYDAQKNSFPPSMTDMLSLLSGLEYFKQQGKEKEYLEKVKNYAIDPTGRWNFGIDNPNNAILKKLNKLVNPTKGIFDVNNVGFTEKEKAIFMAEKESITKDDDILSGDPQAMVNYFSGKIGELPDGSAGDEMEKIYLSIGKKIEAFLKKIKKDIENKAVSSFSDDDIENMNQSDVLMRKLYGYREGSDSPEKRDTLIKELEICWKKMGFRVKYEKLNQVK